nr:MAG TPA: hypothetical protein [Caudoviricetes sp.]
MPQLPFLRQLSKRDTPGATPGAASNPVRREFCSCSGGRKPAEMCAADCSAATSAEQLRQEAVYA